ncbi:MAG: SMP-30/gluconolactonase/LRE family protein, partial [Pseudomonadota bacterium]
MDHIESHSATFDTYILGNAPLRRLATGFTWVEGPVWMGDADCLYFNDIPANTMHSWSPSAGLQTYRTPSNHANGQTRDRSGRLITCEHGSRSVTRTEYDGRITTLASHYEGKRLNSPNDVVVASDGAIWFTDPHYGIVSNFEGFDAPQELPCNVYRLKDGDLQAVITDFNCPNGIAFSPDEARLYIAET